MEIFVWEFQGIPTSPAYYLIENAKKYVEPFPFTLETEYPFFCIGFRPKDGSMKLNVIADKKPVKPVPLQIAKGEPGIPYILYGFSSTVKSVGMTYQLKVEGGKVVQFGVYICNVKQISNGEPRFLAWNLMDGLQGSVMEPNAGEHKTGLYNKPEFFHFMPKLSPGAKLNWVKCMGKPVPPMKERVTVADYTTILMNAFSLRVDKPGVYTIEANYGQNRVEAFRLNVVPELVETTIGSMKVNGEVVPIGSELIVEKGVGIAIDLIQKVPLFTVSMSLDGGTIQDLDGGSYVVSVSKDSKLIALITAHNRKNKANIELLSLKIKSEQRDNGGDSGSSELDLH